MPGLNARIGLWRLRTRLLVPLVILVLLGALSLAAIAEFSARAQAETLVGQRGATVLESIAQRLQERQRAKEIFAQLISDEYGLADLVERGDAVGLGQALVPLKARLGLGYIAVFAGDGRELLHLGSTMGSTVVAPLVTTALSGLTQSIAAVDSGGLTVQASAPIKGTQGIVGALQVGTTFGGDALKEVRDRDAVEVAVFQYDILTATTISDSDLVRLLRESRPAAGGIEQLRATLAPLYFYAVARPLGNGGMLVTLVPTEDLVIASRLRNLMVLLGTGMLLIALLLVGLGLARTVTRPLEAMVRVTSEMMRGNYLRRVAASSIRELNELGGAVNHLAEQLDLKGAELARDIAERQRAEAALRESESRFRRLAENAQDIIYRYELGPKPGIAYVSPAATRLIGYTPEEHYADPDLGFRIVHPDDLPTLQMLAKGQSVSQPVLIRWKHRDGHTVWTEHRIVPIHDDAGNLVATEGIARDVTERVQMQEQLLRAQRLETAGRIAGQVAHDLNNLLSPLTAYPELIKTRLPEDHPVIPMCDAMLQAAQRMAYINEDLLTLGRRGHVSHEPLDLNRLVEQAVSQMPTPPATLALDLHLDRALLPVKGAPAQFLRVITNLLHNARDAMEDLGRLAVRTDTVYLDRPLRGYTQVEMGEYVRLQVSDTGCGISPEIRDRIFDAFFTTKTPDRHRGSGLGLSIVQSIVADHQGYIDLQSEVGSGTTFSLYFPVCREAPREEAGAPFLGGTESILVVDDDRAQLDVAGELLKTLGYQISVASSGGEAVEFVRDHAVDLLILDMIMPPGIDGAETYRQILRERPGQRAIILSGFADSERVREALKLGAGPFVRKPVTLEMLAGAVREGLDRRH